MNAKNKWTSLRGELKSKELMAPYTRLRIGGMAKQFYQPADQDDLREYLQQLSPSDSVVWLGEGQHCVIDDAEIDACVVQMGKGLADIQTLDNGWVRVGGGARCIALAKYCMQHGLEQGLGFVLFSGSMGGAICRNETVLGFNARHFVRRVELISRTGQIYDWDGVAAITDGVVSIDFQFEIGDVAAATERCRQLLNQMEQAEPIGLAHCGAIFYDANEHKAADLLNSCDLAGYHLGGALVSPTHPNFIINDAKASSDDVTQLIQHMHQCVLQKTGVNLQRQCAIIGKSMPQ